ncbi:MAG: anti-sigma factor antagonist [Filimonas sp.]|nr:anti-sigma factor antagonist [Filimonas sp.]
MQVKIDTKEKFTTLSPDVQELSDNLAGELTEVIREHMQKDTKNIILNLQNVQEINEECAKLLVSQQQLFYEQNASFVICCMQPAVEEKLEELELLELLNVTPTESEAWDIIQMEEIERELMDDDEPLFNDHHEG